MKRILIIDAREARGVPNITTLPPIPRDRVWVWISW